MNGIIYRLYNEETTCVEFALYLENVHKIHKLIEKYKFKVYHIKTSPKTNLTIKFNSEGILDVYDDEVKKIKFFQSNDFYYLYMNIFYEVFYAIPHVNKSQNYSYEMLILVEENFDIEKISKHNFNLVNIENCEKLEKDQINFEFIKSFFEKRSELGNGFLLKGEYNYDLFEIGLKHEDFIKNYNNNNPKFELEFETNISSFIFHKKVNQNFYVQLRFKCLSIHIWDFGRNFYIEENKNGKRLAYDDLYESIGCFFTNFGELNNLKVADVTGTSVEFNDLEHYPCTIAENCDTLGIQSCALSKEFVLNGFINTENKSIRVKVGDNFTAINSIIV